MVELVRVHLDIGYCMTSPDIELRKMGDHEPEKNLLPRGVKAMMLGDKIIFIRRAGGRFVPLPEAEQEQLREKHTS